MGELKGQARRGAERRQEILDAAIEVFATRGFRGAALAEVGERVGVSAANVLYHFGSKDELLLAVLAERDRRANADVLASEQRGLAALHAAVRFAEQSEREPGLTALHTVLQIESLDPDSPAHAYFRERSRMLRRSVRSALLTAQKDGEIRSDVDCDAAAAHTVAFLEGAAVLWLVEPRTSLVELYRDHFAWLEDALS